MITLTDKGAEKVHEFLSAQGASDAEAGLRVGVTLVGGLAEPD